MNLFNWPFNLWRKTVRKVHFLIIEILNLQYILPFLPEPPLTLIHVQWLFFRSNEPNFAFCICIHQISPRVLLNTCLFLAKYLESMHLGASLQCIIFGCNVFLKEIFWAAQSFKLFQTHVLKVFLTKFTNYDGQNMFYMF